MSERVHPSTSSPETFPLTPVFHLSQWNNGALAAGDNLSAAIVEIYAGMIDASGHPHGSLVIDIPGVIDAAVVFDLGYTASYVASSAGNAATDGRTFNLICTAAVTPTAGIGSVFTVQNGYPGVIDILAQDGGQSSDYLLWIQSLAGADISVKAYNFLGTLLGADATVATNLSHFCFIRRIYAHNCGRAISFTAINAFGQIAEVWDLASVEGSVFSKCADIQITHWENYSPATQDISLWFYDCNAMNIGTITVGGLPTEALVKIEGSTSPACNFGSIQKLRASRPSYTGEGYGLELLNVKSLQIDNLHTFLNGVGLHATGSSFFVKVHHSMTGEGNGAVLLGNATFPAPNIVLHVWYYYQVAEAIVVGAGITGGSLRLSGRITLPNRGQGATEVVDGSAATGMTIDVANLAIPATYLIDDSILWSLLALIFNQAQGQFGDAISEV